MITRPMKGAAVNDLTVIEFPCVAFPKIDGFRCILSDYPLTSRLSHFPNKYFHTQLRHVLPEGRMLDSEAVVGKRRGPGVLQRTSSGLTSHDGKPDFRLWVFDDPSLPHLPFEARYESARTRVKKLGDSRIRLLEGEVIRNYDQLVAYLELCLKRGFEGIITRSLDGLWKNGKSTLRQQWMLKVKPFETAEGRVTGWYEEMENTNEAKREVTGKLKRSSAKHGKVAKGRLGGLILKDLKTGIDVRVGGGFDDSYRSGLWAIRDTLIGKLVRYKKQSVGEKDKPRHPNFVEFVDFRPEWDMTDD